MINGIFLLLGSNKGDRKHNFREAKKLLIQAGIAIQAESSLYLTPPWGMEKQPYFLNQVVKVETELSPESLMETCLRVETFMGRIRKEKYGPRIIDIDILYYHQKIQENDLLVLPHPRLHLRRFTLIPMTELAGGFIHPGFQKTQEELLADCPDTLPVKKLPSFQS